MLTSPFAINGFFKSRTLAKDLKMLGCLDVWTKLKAKTFTDSLVLFFLFIFIYLFIFYVSYIYMNYYSLGAELKSPADGEPGSIFDNCEELVGVAPP